MFLIGGTIVILGLAAVGVYILYKEQESMRKP